MAFEFNAPTETVVPETTPVEEVIDGSVPTNEPSGEPAVVPGSEDGAVVPDPGGETPPEEVKPVEETTPPENKPEPTDTPEEVEYYFGDEQVGMEIDPGHREAFAEKGLDIDKLAAELYAKDGGFKLSDESYKACCDAFGKFAMDAFLGGLKAQAEGAIRDWKDSQAAQEKADADLYTSIAADIGGDEGWDRLEGFAQETLTDEEFKAFNEVMASGNQYLQRYAVREMEARRKQAQGDDSVSLIEGNVSRTDTESGPLNAKDYIRATSELGNKFPHDKVGYSKAQAALDARRRAGQAAGL